MLSSLPQPTNNVAANATVSEDTTAEASVFTVVNNATRCADDAHTVSFANIRPATDSYEGLDIAQCADCYAVATRPNTEVAPVEKGLSSYISLILGVVCVVLVVVFGLMYVKKSKANREKAIAEYIRNQLQQDYEEEQLSLKEYVDPFTGTPTQEGQ